MEIVAFLNRHGDENICPEKETKKGKQKIDITSKNWAIELKTVNTNYSCKGVENKTKAITDNINGIIKDIEKLKRETIKNKNAAVIFIVFPLNLPKNKKWDEYLKRISKKLSCLKNVQFKVGEVPVVLYIGKVG